MRTRRVWAAFPLVASLLVVTGGIAAYVHHARSRASEERPRLVSLQRERGGQHLQIIHIGEVVMRGRLLLILLVAGLLAVPAFAAVDELRLQVKGLACPFCVYGIEKNLKKLPGVISVETTIRTGVVRVKIAPGTALDVEGFRRAVIDSGFTFEHLEATVTGRLVRRDGRPALETGSGQQAVLLVEAGTEGVSEELSRETLEKLEKASGNGSHMLTVIGRVHGHVGMPPALSLQSFEAAK